MRRSALLVVCLATVLHAQYPPETAWRIIVTPHYEIVFPSEIAADAQRAANTLETLYGPLTESLHTRFKRTTILLPNQNVTRYSGGSVSFFPRMATFNMMPAQGFWGTNDWLTTLTAQEGRHLAQIAKMNHGFGKVASTLFGEAGLASSMFMSLPEWWWAGDARMAESKLTSGAITQYASSEAMTRALLMSDDHFSYMKAIHGSYRDVVPSQAELGSLLMSHVEKTSGPDAWDKIVSRTANRSFSPFAFSNSMKKVTGRSAAANYSETMSQLGELWNAKAENMEFSKPQILNNPAARNVFTGYYQPVFEADGSVLAQKIGLDAYPVEVVRLRPDGSEQRVFRLAPSVIASNRTSMAGGRMVWDEYVPDPRWLRGYSEIVIRDMATGQTRRLTHKSRFMNPVLSPDGSHVAVVEYLPDRTCSLVILDANTGAEVKRLPSPANDMIYTPAWSEDGRRLAMVTHNSGGRALVVAGLDSSEFQEVIPHGHDDLVNPVFFRDHVLYKSSHDGIDNIYAVRIADGIRYRVTASKFGANYPAVSPDGTKLLYSDYTASGFNLAELPLDPTSWRPIDTVPFSGLGYFGVHQDFGSQIPNTQYPVERYHPSAHLFDFHSWGFTSGPPDLGFGLFTNDKMGLMGGNVSYLFNTNERTSGFETGFSYSRFFPVLDFSFSDRNRSVQYATYKDNWNERTVSGGFHVPLNFSRGYYNTGVDFWAGIQSISLRGVGLEPLYTGIAFFHSRQRATRDLASPWSQVLRLSFHPTLLLDGLTGNFLSTDGRFSIPGFARHHTIRLEGGYERQHGSYTFSSEILFPRGYRAFTGPDLTKLSANYGVPLLYPDLSLGQLVYIKRVSGNLYYDYGKVGDNLYRSTGLETIFDVGLLHFPFTFQGGVRYAYLLDFRSSRVQPFLDYRW